MYPAVPFDGLSWPMTQHAGMVSEDVINGLLNACLLCKGKAVDPGVINEYLVKNDILTANVRSDSNQVDAWRDYQQILSEFGLIYSTRISKIIKLTPVAIAYLNHSLSYSELMTLQVLRYQYPNGHKTQLSPSLVQSCNGTFSYDNLAAFQTANRVQIRPAVLVWDTLNKLWQKGLQPTLTLDEMQRFVVRCTTIDDTDACVSAIIDARKNDVQLEGLPRARRNMSDWMKILGQTMLFKLNATGDTVFLSQYSIRERRAVDQVCNRLSDFSSFWLYEEDNYKQKWFEFYGDYDNSIDLILKEAF